MARKINSTAPGLTYLGPNSGFDHDEREIHLMRGATYHDLPLDHPIIQNLIASELLVEADQEQTSAGEPALPAPEPTTEL